MSQCHIDDGPKILVVSLTADVARIDTVLRERLRTCRILREKQVPVVVKVADDGDRQSEPVQRLDDLRNGGGRRLVVDGDPNELAAGAGEIRHLPGG
jgi:hypothetical protein